jgi:hypothetical protein
MKLFLTLLTLLLMSCAHAPHLQHEADYVESWCSEKGGIVEYVLPDKTRVDCLLDDYAVEFDFAEKWEEAIGQANLYANETGRDPGVVLIMEDPERDYKYLLLLLNGIEDSPQRWRVWTMEPEDLG